MNRNQMDRYYRRFRQPWSGDNRSAKEIEGPRPKLTAVAVVILLSASVVTTILLSLNSLR